MSDSKKTFTDMVNVCNHCGNKGIMEIHGSFKNSGYENYWFEEIFLLLKCPVCFKPVLLREHSDEDSGELDQHGELYYPIEITTLYPEQSLDSSVPPIIKTAWLATLATRFIDNYIFALSARRTLELIAVEQKAEGKDLIDKIRSLNIKGVLPGNLRDVADITRVIGNIGAHSAGTIQITESEINILQKFIGYIIQYLYVLPNDIKKLEYHLNKEKKKSSSE